MIEPKYKIKDIPVSMKAMQISKFGGPEVFEPVEVGLPQISAQEVLIQVFATSVNPLDVKLRGGLMPLLAPEFPAILHGDFAGKVVAKGSLVQNVELGDRVFGCAGGIKGAGGALAEYMSADSRLLAKLPHDVSYEEGAAIALVGLTAWEALFDKVVLEPESRVLILGGTGGVAHIALQLARLRTASVYATASTPEKEEILLRLGARTVFDYQHADFDSKALGVTKSGSGFDIVFDTVGGKSLDRAMDLARNYGHIVTCQSAAEHNLSPLLARSLSLHSVLMLLPMLTGQCRNHHQYILENLAFLMSKKVLTPLLDSKKFSLEQIGEAHRHLESGKALGKVVIRIS